MIGRELKKTEMQNKGMAEVYLFIYLFALSTA
jgi:hypothetical protein